MQSYPPLDGELKSRSHSKQEDQEAWELLNRSNSSVMAEFMDCASELTIQRTAELSKAF